MSPLAGGGGGGLGHAAVGQVVGDQFQLVEFGAEVAPGVAGHRATLGSTMNVAPTKSSLSRSAIKDMRVTRTSNPPTCETPTSSPSKLCNAPAATSTVQ